jgi:predicted acetyltransferase
VRRGKLENTRVAVLNGAVVSVVQVADRAMLVDGVPVRQGFINFVGTDPAHRGHGYGALLLWDAAEYMERAGYPLSLIPGEGVEPFYEREGWRNFRHYYKLTLRL